MVKFVLTVLVLFFSYAGFGQSANLFAFNKRKLSLSEVIDVVEQKSPCTFWYRSDVPDRAKPIKLTTNEISIEKVMELCVEGQPFTYKMIDSIVVLIPASNFSKWPLTRRNTLSNTGNQRELVGDGYSEQDSKNLTSSISRISSNDLNRSTSGGLLDNISVSGLQISKNAKGDNASLLIRGKSTIMGSSEPLVVLDGIPYSGNINQIDRESIESINVLKDAGAAAIYGSRGGNGVIVITTKKARFVDNKLVPLPKTISEKDGFMYFKNASGYDILDRLMAHFSVKLFLKDGVLAESYTGKIPSTISLIKMMEIMKAVGFDITSL